MDAPVNALPDRAAQAGQLRARVQALEAAFRHIALHRMRGVPVLNPALQVQAVGFAPVNDGAWAWGVLVTPWFMNLLRLPLAPCAQARPDDADGPVDVGRSAARTVGSQVLDFVGAQEDSLGHYEQCSLFSPMFNFADQAAAVATAHEVLRLLRATRAPGASAAASAPGPGDAAPAPPPAPAPARRGFLFGRARSGA